MALHNIVVPALIVTHRGDAGDATPATEAEKLKSRLINAHRERILLSLTVALRQGPSRVTRFRNTVFSTSEGRQSVPSRWFKKDNMN
jgi:hypothetical protein